MAIETLPEPSIAMPITTARPRFGFLLATPIIATASILLLLITVMSILAPWIAPHDPMQLLPAQRLRPASEQFLLGTDAFGRDVLSRIIYGGRISLLIGFGATVLMRDSTSRPKASVPSRNCSLAGLRRCAGRSCIGSCGAIQGARIDITVISRSRMLAVAMIGVASRKPNRGRAVVIGIAIEGSGRVSIAISSESSDQATCRRRRSRD